MAKPLVAVVGRSNVGKSTFFNKIAGDRIAIVKDIPGVTRDRIYADATWCGRAFSLVDTGGIEVKSSDPMAAHIKEQAEIAIDLADVILFMTDAVQGLTGGDEEIADILRRAGKPVIVAVNKLDCFDPAKTYEFFGLGFESVFGVSCEQGLGLGDLLDEAVKFFPPCDGEEDEGAIKIAVVGEPNAGKSSLVNRLLGYERVIVSDIAGTTRDSIDTVLTVEEQKFILIDTAGLRRKRGVETGSVEAISALKAMRSIERADIVLVVSDATAPMTEQCVRIAGYAHEAGKASVIVMNKWDIVEKDSYTMEKSMTDIKERLKFMDYFHILFVSAKTGQRTNKIFESVNTVYANATRRIPTGQLNDILADAVGLQEPPTFSGRRLKIMYATQRAVQPPTFVLFCNDATLMHFSYLRYLENAFRRAVDFSGTPLKIETRSRKD